jgi:RNA polymerase sigma-70 factor (ECF subfamily)
METARAERLFRKSGAERWQVPLAAFAAALDRSVAKAFAGRSPSPADVDRYCDSLRLDDLALACACALGHEPAWDHFVAEFRPALYRAADAIDPAGGAREAADALYGELFGLKEKDGDRQSLFRYFHGRSSLATWLRSLVSQRYVDRIRVTRRLDPLPEDASPAALPARPAEVDPDRPRFTDAVRAALTAAMAALAPRDRLRLACYYAQEMTLAQIGKLTREHEATVSRQLARTRRDIRAAVERRLRDEHRFADPEIAESFAAVLNDSGELNLATLLEPGAQPAEALAKAGRKKSESDRSPDEDLS